MKLLFPALLAAVLTVLAPAPTAAQNWTNTIRQTEHGHEIGDPEADISLASFVSYTCPHCAAFEKASDAPLQIAYIRLGKVRLEVRPLIRNPIDLAAALLAECGPPEKFFANHRAIMFAQNKWLPKAVAATPAQQQRWVTGPFGSRMRAIASDMDFYEIMERRGYPRIQSDRCLTDQARATTIATDSKAESERYNVRGTPSFLLDGKLLADVHDWPGVEQALNTKLALSNITAD